MAIYSTRDSSWRNGAIAFYSGESKALGLFNPLRQPHLLLRRTSSRVFLAYKIVFQFFGTLKLSICVRFLADPTRGGGCRSQKKVFDSLEVELPGSCESPCGCWEPTPSPLQKQVLLT